MTNHPGSTRYECLNCKSTRSAIKEKYGEVIVCELCNGAMVDQFYIYKYKAAAETKTNNDMQIKVEVDTSEMDVAIEKAKQLNELTKEYEDRTKHKDDALVPIANAIAAIQHIQSQYRPDKKEKLLVIEIDDIHSVPRIIHKGERINMITTAHFEWNTDNEYPQPKSYHIEHYDEEERCFKNIGSSK
ncbi:hypothetical protein SAMN05421503_2489 [Terribacillus aidingensis]|uniref:Uncharacterized protein n=1 Tax=Terribacillus aidingensis TaxID=586416 RepID=A0A285NZW8_9BACI|nr:hypothetical protein [Terribacillus aidingensis]SNZ14567.1 hypothetical protein SAMN05421503_2489 [Terribacillus aidingensis]